MSIKRLEKILVNVVGTIVALYAAFVLTFSLPFMQRKLAGWMADVLSDRLKAKVEIGSVSFGLLNHITIDDITLHEPGGEKLANIARASVSVNPLLQLSGRVNINMVQLFGVNARLCKPTPASKPNYQFLLDAFTNEDNDTSKTLDLRIGSLILRHADISYDVLSEQRRSRTIDTNHLNLHNLGTNVMLRHLTGDSINLQIRRMQGEERNSGLAFHSTKLHLVANGQTALLSNFAISLPHSKLSLDSLRLDYGEYETQRRFTVAMSPLNGRVTPSDLAPLLPQLTNLQSTIECTVQIDGTEQEMKLKRLTLQSGDNLSLTMQATVQQPLDKERRTINANIERLHLSPSQIQTLANILTKSDEGTSQTKPLLTSAPDLEYKGSLAYSNSTLQSAGQLLTDIGAARYDLAYDSEGSVSGTIEADSVNLGKIFNDNPDLGKSSFSIDLALSLNTAATIPSGHLEAKVSSLHFMDYDYHDIKLNAQSTPKQLDVTVNIDDENLKAAADANITNLSSLINNHSPQTTSLALELLLESFNPNKLNLTDKYEGDNLSLEMKANLHGTDIKNLMGHVGISNLKLSTPLQNYSIDYLTLTASNNGTNSNLYTIDSHIVKSRIEGEVNLSNLVTSINNQLAIHIPLLVSPKQASPTRFDYDVNVADAPIIHHFIKEDFSLVEPLHIKGSVDSPEKRMSLQMSAPCLEYNGRRYDHLALSCSTNPDNMNIHALASSLQQDESDDDPSTTTRLDVTADIHDNRINSDLYIDIDGRNRMVIQLLPTVQMSDSLGSMKTNITIRPSSAVINDTVWNVSPSTIELFRKDITCKNIRFANGDGSSSITVSGKATSSPNDSIVATFKKMEIQYITSLINFDAVQFTGKASGQAIVNNVMGGTEPDLRANIYVEDLTIQEGPLGDANITAHWNKGVHGIAVEGRIVDLYSVSDALTDKNKNMTGVTTVNGWISPARNDIRLNVNTINTNASFMHGFLGGVFKEITGYVNGPLSIIGPLNDVNIVGDVVPNMNLRLRATNVPYHIEGDTMRLRPYLFDFRDISIYDRFGHRSIINGKVTHRNMKNFAYNFNADLHELLAYDESHFNSDKFLATVFADGTLAINGSDGHPLRVNASITPTRGSVFAYDAATPDAITGNSFIEFRDRDSLLAITPRTNEQAAKPQEKDSLAIVKEAKKNYNSDIYINFDINLTPDCEVKLRMDNIEDGYMRTFGNAKLTAQWYNKGSFQLFGNYNITAGSYRLYLQDIIFRDLALQPGSIVEFNGSPFDANIHLICNHTINSVPLSDLTATTAFSQNNKVKVVCVLDITGKLGNMDFKFDMDLPNVNEEVRQLVRSMVNSEEEMNTQMIYLLGLGRFYPNEYARANGGDNSGQAVNSLLSSTLSGQINQMLSNIIGNNTNWNFGSSLTTGEKGWDDLDVEGILSGRMLDERLLINGAFGYRDNALTNQGNFIGDFEVKWRMNKRGSLYIKAYNQTNDRYFTKATLNTQGLGLSWRHDFETIRSGMSGATRTKKSKHKK